MNSQKTRLKVIVHLAIVFLIVGFCSMAQAAIVVNMNVSDTEDELVITTHGTCQGTNVPNGCMAVTGGKQQINFNLVGNRDCSMVAGEKWKLDSVVLSESKGAESGISQVASDDFGADIDTGEITQPVSENDSHIGVRDDNTAAYDIWYTVTAKCGSTTINTDPRIKNDGSGRN